MLSFVESTTWTTYLLGLTIMCVLALLTWLLSLRLKDVSIVDSAWSLMFLAASVFLFSLDMPLLLLTQIFSFWSSNMA